MQSKIKCAIYTRVSTNMQVDVAFISVTERIDTSTPSERLLRNIMLTFAQFERELTSERKKNNGRTAEKENAV